MAEQTTAGKKLNNADSGFTVLTGDVVDSTALSSAQRQRIFEAIDQAGESTRKRFSVEKGHPKIGTEGSETPVFRGDSFQLVLCGVSQCVSASLFFRSVIAGSLASDLLQPTLGSPRPVFDVRIGIGIGDIELTSGTSIQNMTGKAFELAGSNYNAPVQLVEDFLKNKS